MILLDTNVVSALMAQDDTVVAWLDTQPAESIWLTSITVFEAEFGLALLPAGKRRKALEAAFAALLSEDLEGRVVSFDTAAASAAARLAAERRRAGRPVDMRDTQIAGIAISRRATVATRNVRHFEGLPTAVVSPWDPG
jgi:predicted nucleic acid-binding protein